VSTNYISQLVSAAQGRGLSIRECANGHCQIVGGPLLVNYYPLSKRRSAYIAGTTKRFEHVTPERAVAMAFEPPVVRREHVVTRKGKYRALRRRLLRKDPHCHWCRCDLTLDTSTADHVIPLRRGGLDNPNNIVLACEPCNNKRGHAMPELSRP
jgi:5-methylcytosine-specific restriction endonuclease McrA